MNQIGYDKWRTIIRLPYLILHSAWLDQRRGLYRAQIARLVDRLGEVYRRESGQLLGQLADDAARELVGQFRDRQDEDSSHFALQCARALEAARSAMTPSEFERHVGDAAEQLESVCKAVPWHVRARARLVGPSDRPANDTLRRALAEAVPHAAPGFPSRALGPTGNDRGTTPSAVTALSRVRQSGSR